MLFLKCGRRTSTLQSNNVEQIEAVGTLAAWNAFFFSDRESKWHFNGIWSIMEFCIYSIWFFFFFSSSLDCLACTRCIFCMHNVYVIWSDCERWASDKVVNKINCLAFWKSFHNELCWVNDSKLFKMHTLEEEATATEPHHTTNAKFKREIRFNFLKADNKSGWSAQPRWTKHTANTLTCRHSRTYAHTPHIKWLVV